MLSMHRRATYLLVSAVVEVRLPTLYTTMGAHIYSKIKMRAISVKCVTNE